VIGNENGGHLYRVTSAVVCMKPCVSMPSEAGRVDRLGVPGVPWAVSLTGMAWVAPVMDVRLGGFFAPTLGTASRGVDLAVV
jgi:hypothetical protein